MSAPQVARIFQVHPLTNPSTKGDFKKVEFELTEVLLVLLTRMSVRYRSDAEFGAPVIDPKRPYLSSDPYKDITEILGLTCKPDENGDFSEEDRAEMDALHQDTETALQIVLHTAKFEPGVYEGLEIVPGKYGRYWKKVRDIEYPFDEFDRDPAEEFQEEERQKRFIKETSRNK